MASIEINQVSKSYGNTRAIKEASFSIPENCLFGLIGPDGSGKTTLFRMITTLLLPDTGNINVFGLNTDKDYRKIRLFTGYMPGRFSLYPDLTVEENLTFYATIFKTTRKENYKLIEPVYALLEPFKNRLARNLSGGMKQKLALSCALIHNPKLLVLDEPTTGVDAVSRKEFWDNLKILKDSGMTILVSTPYMDEAVRCERVALMQQGDILSEAEPGQILEDYKRALFEITAGNRFELLETLRTMPEVKSAYLFGQSVHVTMQAEQIDTGWLRQMLDTHGLTKVSMRIIKPDFEDCFIEAVEDSQTHTSHD